MIVPAPIRVTVWGENFHENAERDRAEMAERYPDGMHGAIAAGLRESLGAEVEVRTATQDEPEHGLPAEVLDNTDVMTWWGHATHADVADEIVDRVHERVLGGMGLLVLHSAHFSKIFKRLMGTTCSLAWRDSADTELVWTVDPEHPIADGVPHPIVIEEQETYGEFFDIPATGGVDLPLDLHGRGGVPLRVRPGDAAAARSSTSHPVTRAIPSITTPTSSGCWPTPYGGPRRRPRETSRRRRWSTSRRRSPRVS